MQLNHCYNVIKRREAHDRRVTDRGATIVGKAEVVSSILTGSTIFYVIALSKSSTDPVAKAVKLSAMPKGSSNVRSWTIAPQL